MSNPVVLNDSVGFCDRARLWMAILSVVAMITDLSYLADGVTVVVVDRSGMLHWWDVQPGRRLSD